MWRIFGAGIWKRHYIGILSLMMMFGAVAQTQDSWVWRQNIEIGPLQSAELILASGGCNEPFTVAVETTDQDGLVVHELVQVTQQSAGVVYPLPESYGLAERSRFGIRLEVEPGPCAHALQAALVIVNEDETTAAVSRIPKHAPEGSDFNANAPGISADEGGPTNYINVHSTRIGPGQLAEFAFWSNCPEEISVALELRTIGTEEEEVIPLKIDVAPLAFAQASVAVPAGRQSVSLVGFGSFSVKDRPADGNPCPPGLGALTGILSLVDDQGNTTHTSGLPTGKRQHKPVSITKPSE